MQQTVAIKFEAIDKASPKLYALRAALGVKHVMDQLTAEDIAYATGKGFAALHDICDANTLLPGVDEADFDPSCQETADFLNAVMDGVTVALGA